MDALFAGVATGAVTAIVVALSSSGARSDALAAIGGLLGGAALLLSYGSAALVVFVLAVAMLRRSYRSLSFAAVGATAVLGAAAVAGFSWPAGLEATASLYSQGVAGARPYSFFVFSNLAAFALVVGPAVAGGIARLWSDRSRILVVGGLAAVLAADLSGLSKGEVERIWLPFAPWILVAAGALPPSRARFWLTAQALVALGIAVFVRTPW